MAGKGGLEDTWERKVEGTWVGVKVVFFGELIVVHFDFLGVSIPRDACITIAITTTVTYETGLELGMGLVLGLGLG